jgi:hypothetical protein
MNLNSLDHGYMNLKYINFNDKWKGSASSFQQSELNEVILDLEKCLDNLYLFEELLRLKEKYIVLCNEIVVYDSLITLCSADHSLEIPGCNCSNHLYAIKELEQKRLNLRELIIEQLGTFGEINIELDSISDLTTYDNSNYKYNIDGFPIMNQLDYAGVKFSENSYIDESGCALTCAAMIISAYTGEIVTPEMLMEKYPYVHNNQTTMNNMLAMYGIKSANSNYLHEEDGKKHNLTADDIYIDGGFTEIDSKSMRFVAMYEKLQEGYVFAICLGEKNQFTGGVHYVLATGVNEDGTINIVDPYGKDYNKLSLQDGFENGFDKDFIEAYWSGGYLVESRESYLMRKNNQE